MTFSATIGQTSMLRRALPFMLVAALLLAGTHAFTVWQHRVARDVTRPLPERLAAARRAVAIEPFNDRYAVTATTVRAEVALSAGDVDRAYFLLLPLSTTVRGDELFRQTYQEALAAKAPLDARKAHQQHAKEKKDGALAPEDVFK